MGNLGRISIRIESYNEKVNQLLPVFKELERQKFGKFHNNYYICPTKYNISGAGILAHMFNYCRMQGISSLMFILNDSKKEEDL